MNLRLCSKALIIATKQNSEMILKLREDLISFAECSCSMFWSHLVIDSELPGAVTGKLGGPSQRRLSSPITTAVLQAILSPFFIVSVGTVATVSTWCAPFKEDARLNLASTFLWNFFHRVVSTAVVDSETNAEIFLAAYEALSFALNAWSMMISSSTINLIQEMNGFLDPLAKDKPILDPVVLTFLHHVNSLLAVRHLAQTRRAVLMN